MSKKKNDDDAARRRDVNSGDLEALCSGVVCRDGEGCCVVLRYVMTWLVLSSRSDLIVPCPVVT
jgi:hypothetical protein